MMEDSVKKVDINITSAPRMYDIMVSDAVVFTTFSFMFCAAGLGWFPADAAFSLGVIQVTLAGLFFVGARERAKFNQFWGNVNFIFVFCFGVFGGVTNLLTGLGIPLNGVVLSIPNLVVGAVMLCTLPGVRHDPWTGSVMYALAAIAVFFLGLAGIGILTPVLNCIASICLGGVGILGFWSIVITLNGFTGFNLPAGKPLFK